MESRNPNNLTITIVMPRGESFDLSLDKTLNLSEVKKSIS